jgi:hypothetical protein
MKGENALTYIISQCYICGKILGSKKELKDHIDENHRMTDHHKEINPNTAERIADDILSSTNLGGVIGVSLIDSKGNTLSAKSRDSFRKLFRLAFRDGDKNNNYGGALAIATLSVVNQVRDIFGEPQAIITVHKDCKLMLIPLPSYDILVGLVLERRADADDGKMVSNIERLVADTIVPEIIDL